MTKSIQEVKNKQGVVTAYRAYYRHQGKLLSKQLKTRKEAEEWLLREKARITIPQTSRQSLMYSLACNNYLNDCSSRQRSNTIHEKYTHFSELAAFMGSDFEMDSFGVVDGREFLCSIFNEKGAKTANRRLRSMKALWNWHSGEISFNPWRQIKPFPEKEFIKYVPSSEDVEKVLSVAESFEKRLITAVLFTGARIGEILNLKWEDVSENYIRLWTRKRKNGSMQSRTVPITPALAAVFAEQKKDNSSDFVFFNASRGQPYNSGQKSVFKILPRLCKQAGVQVFGFHALRHFVATQLLRSGKANISEIQTLLGHQRVSTTDIYLKSLTPELTHMQALLNSAVLRDLPCFTKL